jgi:leucyl-tRNA synthetase
MNSFSGIDDINVEYSKIEKVEEILLEWLNFAKENWNRGSEVERFIDRWFIETLKKTLKEVESFYEELNYRDVIQKWFELEKNFKWYLRRCVTPSKKALNEYIKIRSLIVYPIIPHLISEIFEIIKEKIEWPKIDKIDEEMIMYEEFIKKLIEDIEEIKKISKKEKINEIKIIVAKKEKYEFFKKIKESNLNFIEKEKELSKFLKRKVSAEVLNLFFDREIEMKLLEENKDFIEKNYNCELVIEEEENSNEEKREKSLPGKPAIVLL